jgi:hypothetical protein
MDDIEAQFIGSVTNQMGRIDKSVTDGQNSEKSGLSNQKTMLLRQQIAQQMASNPNRANVDGGYYPPSIDPNTQLEPLQITPEMIKEIRELEDDILPEMKKSGANIGGNPSSLRLSQQSQIPVNNQNTPQLEFNFEQKTIDTIYEKLDDLEQKMEKQFKVAKQLLEAILNDKKE